MATTHMPMAAARQPFAPLNGSRLQNLTSLKNRQNALPSTFSSPGKRKATTFLEEDNAENIDPVIFLSPKRSKGPDGISKENPTPSQFFLTPAPPSPNDLCSPLKFVPQSIRPILPVRSPGPKLNTTSISKSSPLSAPAGRSPTRKRIGILNRRRTASLFSRVDPPRFSSSSASSTGLGFSIDAALSGTIPSYASRQRQTSLSSSSSSVPVSLHEPVTKESWFFDIHEDTDQELATNLMEHSTCTLDISSDEESAARMKDERGKENVPPMDDISQTRTYISNSSTSTSTSDMKSRVREARRRKELDSCEIEIDRSPLGEMLAEDFYPEDCDGSSVVIIPAEIPPEAAEEDAEGQQETSSIPFSFTADLKGKGREIDIDVLMQQPAQQASLLEPLERVEEGFEVWEESGSSNGDD